MKENRRLERKISKWTTFNKKKNLWTKKKEKKNIKWVIEKR